MTCLELGRWFSKNEWRLLVPAFCYSHVASIFLFGVFAQCYFVSTCTVHFPGPPISGKSGRPRQPELGIWISPFSQFKTPAFDITVYTYTYISVLTLNVISRYFLSLINLP